MHYFYLSVCPISRGIVSKHRQNFWTIFRGVTLVCVGPTAFSEFQGKPRRRGVIYTGRRYENFAIPHLYLGNGTR